MDTVRSILEAHRMPVPADEMARRIHLAIGMAGGFPAYVPGSGVRWPDVAGDDVGALPAALADRFVGVVDRTLHEADDATQAAGTAGQLTVGQTRLLDRGFGVPGIHPRAQAALELAAMHATALPVDAASTLLRMTTAELLGLIDERRLYSLAVDDGRLLPIFQFDDAGKPVPHLGDVLPRLGPHVHPVGVLHWFVEPNPDLATAATRYLPTSPRDWLLHGFPAHAVAELARHVV